MPGLGTLHGKHGHRWQVTGTTTSRRGLLGLGPVSMLGAPLPRASPGTDKAHVGILAFSSHS